VIPVYVGSNPTGHPIYTIMKEKIKNILMTIFMIVVVGGTLALVLWAAMEPYVNWLMGW